MGEWKGEWKGEGKGEVGKREGKREGKLEEMSSGIWRSMFGTYTCPTQEVPENRGYSLYGGSGTQTCCHIFL